MDTCHCFYRFVRATDCRVASIQGKAAATASATAAAAATTAGNGLAGEGGGSGESLIHATTATGRCRSSEAEGG